MSDPLSIAGLVTGVVSLGLKVAAEITKYLNALECREKDTASMRQQTGSLETILQIIEESLNKTQEHQQVTAAVRGCGLTKA